MRKAVLLLLAAVVTFGPLSALAAPGPAPDMKARVGGLLERFPADSPADRDALAAEVLRLGPKAVLEICARVLPPEAGDDTKARFALNALAVHVTRPGSEAERRAFVGALLKGLDRATEPEAIAFLLSQVQIAGRGEAVRPMRRYLRDERLAEPAVQALLAIRGPAAERVLLKALGSSPAPVRPTLIKALGELRSLRAVKKILPYAESPDANTRTTALFALANIGDPAAGPILERSRVAASSYERAQAPSLYLLYARRLAESGGATEALAAARSLLAHYTNPEESRVAAQALSLLVSVLKDGALSDLLAVMDTGDRKLRGAALELAAEIPGIRATSALVERAGTLLPEVRADIVAMLGRRGDREALPFVRSCLTDADVAVRREAVPAAARLGGEAVLPDLFALIDSEDEAELAVLKDVLLGFPGAAVVPEAARRLERTGVAGKAVLIGLIGEKGAREEIERVFALAEDPEPAVRTAAVRALAELAGPRDVPRLIRMLAAASEAADIFRLQEAAAAAASREPDPESRADVLLGLMDEASPREKISILRVLPRIGGPKAVKAVVDETRSEDGRVRGVAVASLGNWPDLGPADDLLRIAATSEDRRDLLLAARGFAQLVVRSALPGWKKLERFRAALAEVADDSAKRSLLMELYDIREPGTFRLLAEYLDHPVLGESAAASLLEMASSQAPHERWLSGHEAISVLRRMEAAANDPAEKDRIGEIITDRLRQGGFTPLFNGRDLDGWKGLAADERMRAHWQAVDGVLVFDGKGENLCTVRDYGDFELLVDWKIEAGGDSGIYLRGSPQVQIWDAESNPAGSGGLYNNQKGPSQPLQRADRPAGEWNSFRIIMLGERVTVYLNDRMVVDNTVLENYWERDKPIYPSGPIELQAHGSPLYFKNIFIREIARDTSVPEVTAVEAAEGFRPLFNGRDLDGWTGDTEGYLAENGKLVVHPERQGGNLYTEKEYADFILRFDFRLTPAANNGLGVRAPLEGDAAYAGMEIQILEDGSPRYWDLRSYQYHGSVYGVVPARRGALRPVGEWNSQEVTLRGRRVTVVVNGTTVVDADLDAASAAGTADGREHPGLKRDRGHIGFLGHGSIVEFRNIRIREVD